MEGGQTWKTIFSTMYFLSFIMIGMVISALGPFIPFKASSSGRKETDYGILFSFRGAGYLLGSMLIGRLQEKICAHKLMAMGLGLVALTSFIAAKSDNIMILAVNFFISGSGCSTIDVLAQSSIVEVHGEKVDPWMQFLHFCFGLGALSSPILIAMIGQSSFTWLGLIALILIVGFLRYPSPRLHKEATGNNKEEELAALPQELENILAASFLIYVGLEVGYGGWISTYGTMSGYMTKSEAAYGSSVFWLSISVGRVLGVPMASRYPTNVQLKTLMYASVVSIFLANFITSWGASAIYLSSIMYGLAISAIYPLLMGMPTFLKFRLTAKNASTFVVAGSLGEAGIPILSGWLINWFGAGALFPTSLVYTLIMFSLFLAIERYEKMNKSTLSQPMLKKSQLMELNNL